MDKRKQINNDLQNTTQTTKERVTQSQLITEGDLRCLGRVHSSCSTSGIRRVTLITSPVTSHD